jgi:hypothetical protein
MEMLPFGLSTLTARTVRQSSGDMEFFVDSVAGNDANDGLSWATAKQTLQAGFNLVPYVISSPPPNYYTVVLHLKGTFTLDGSETCEHLVQFNGRVLITGTDDVVIVDDNGGSNYTATSSSASSLGVAGTPWATDNRIGLIVQILSGPAAGQSRTVQKNTTNSLTPTIDWSTNPGACTFRFVRPETTITSSSGRYIFFVTEGLGLTVVQKIYFSGNLVLSGDGRGYLTYTHCVCDGTVGMLYFSISSFRGPVYYDYYSYETSPPFNQDSLKRVGVGWRSIASRTLEFLRAIPYIHGSVVPTVVLKNCRMEDTAISSGTRMRSLTLISCHCESTTTASVKNIGSSALVMIDNGMKAISSSIGIGPLTLSNITGSAIEAEDSRVRFIDTVAGTGNTKAGMYAWGRSYVTFVTGKTPTVTGTIGDLSTDNTTLKSTWAAIAGGTPVNDTTEMVVVKKV